MPAAGKARIDGAPDGDIIASAASRRPQAARPSMSNSPANTNPDHPRVMHVITDLDTGGAETVLTNLALAESRAGRAPVLVSLVPGGAQADRLRRAGLAPLDLGMSRGVPDPFGVFRLAGLIRVERPDVIQGWMYHADLCALLALIVSGRRRQTRICWGIRCSNMDTARHGLALKAVIWACARLSGLPDCVVANSRAGADWHTALGYRVQEIHVIENGIDSETIAAGGTARDDIRGELGLATDAFVIGTAARVDPMKDYATLRSAVGEMAGVVCLAAGRDTDTLPPAPDMIGLGERRDMPRVYAALDVFVSSSAYGEGFSNAIAEAMAAGLPVVATDVGEARRIVGDTGRIVPPGQPEALAQAVMELKQDTALRQDLGRRAALRIRRNFSLDRMVGRFRDLHACRA